MVLVIMRLWLEKIWLQKVWTVFPKCKVKTLIGSKKVPTNWVKTEITSILFCLFSLNEFKSDRKLKGNKWLRKTLKFVINIQVGRSNNMLESSQTFQLYTFDHFRKLLWWSPLVVDNSWKNISLTAYYYLLIHMNYFDSQAYLHSLINFFQHVILWTDWKRCLTLVSNEIAASEIVRRSLSELYQCVNVSVCWSFMVFSKYM